MQKIVISTEVAGFVPEESLLLRLYATHPEAFDPNSFAPEDFGLTDKAADQVAVSAFLTGAVLVGGRLWFLRQDDAVRALPGLVEEVERRGGANCVWREGSAKVIEVPDDVQWYIVAAEDGSESVHEKHRIWT